MRPLQDLFPPSDYPDLLVGLGKPDDAAVWRLDQTQSLVVTTDFFTPVVDTPYEYGAIAAANALSDLYAMGAKPLFALNIAAMPAKLPPEVIREILLGGAEKVRQAGAVIAGGHTIQDDEPKYGLVAIGIAQTDQLITKENLRSGDLLILTKPLGMGVTTTALKNGACSPSDEAQAIEWMSRLNQQAAELAIELGIIAGTDITGFGFLGHALELATASDAGIELWLESIPFLHGALEYVKAGHFPGGSADNSRFFGDQVTFATEIDGFQQMLLFDAQTSGGLLLALPADRAEEYLQRAQEVGQAAWVVGQVFEAHGGNMPKVTIIGAGQTGATTAHFLAMKDFTDIVLLDIVEGMPQGKGLDLTEAMPVIGSDAYIEGANDYAATAGSDVVVITAGLPRKPGMSRDDLVEANTKIIRASVEGALKHSPDAIFIILTNPLDAMSYLAMKISGLPRERVIGQAGILDSARMRAFVAMELDVSVQNIHCYVLGGHGDDMVPLTRHSNVAGVPLETILPNDRLEAIVERTRKGGGEIVGLLKTGSAFYAPAAALAQMVEAILLDRHLIVPASVYLEGEYGQEGIFFGVPAQLGRGGLEKVIEYELSAQEQKALEESANHVRETIATLKV